MALSNSGNQITDTLASMNPFTSATFKVTVTANSGGAPFSPDTVPNPDMCAAAQVASAGGYGKCQAFGCAKVYIIGVGKTLATNPSSAYSGPAQDIGGTGA